jgi:hypothetical protein
VNSQQKKEEGEEEEEGAVDNLDAAYADLLNERHDPATRNRNGF